MGLLKTTAFITGGLVLAWRFGFVDLPKLLNIGLFGAKADFQIRNIHNLSFQRGMGTQLSMLLDFTVENKSSATVTAKQLQLHVFDKQGKWVGSSVPYNYPIKISPHSIIVVPNVQVVADATRLLLDVAAPQLLQYLQNGGKNNTQGQKLGKTLVIHLSIELNGIMVNQTINYDF